MEVWGGLKKFIFLGGGELITVFLKRYDCDGCQTCMKVERRIMGDDREGR